MFSINSFDIGALWSSVWPYLLAILLFGIIIAIHEFGHFFFAKLFKVKVNEFSLGMGPKLISKKKGETLYALRLFPIGGFVSMEGEDEESSDDRAFNKKPAWQRFIIVAAGAILNLILGVVVVAVCLSCSDLVGSRTVHSFVVEDAPSQISGLCAGDEIVEINDTHIYSAKGVSFNLVRDTDNKIDMTVIRDGEKLELKDVEFKQFEYDGKMYIEQDFALVGYEPTVGNVVKNAFLDSASIIQMVRLSLVDLVSGRYGLREVSGPVGTISAIAQSTAEPDLFAEKILMALNFLSMITINVGVFNLLPVPALDGGRLFFIFIEMIRRKPIPAKKEGLIHTIGLALLLGFMLIVSISDIVKLF